MKTKLDEMVEETEKQWGWNHHPAATDLAERAFNEGTDQMRGECLALLHAGLRRGDDWTKLMHDLSSVSARPAPAGERSTCSCRGFGTYVSGNLVHRTDGPCFVDRRKGRRRSGCEHGTGYMTYVRHLQYDGRDWTCGGIDRRSGKDRRHA